MASGDIDAAVKQLIVPLLERQKVLAEELKKIDAAVNAIKDICVHDFISTGIDGDKECFKCSICGKVTAW